MESASGTEVMYKRESRLGVTTLTFRSRRYKFPNMIVQGDDLNSQGLCAMVDVGLFCPYCAGNVSAQLSGTHTRVAVSRGTQSDDVPALEGRVNHNLRAIEDSGAWSRPAIMHDQGCSTDNFDDIPIADEKCIQVQFGDPQTTTSTHTQCSNQGHFRHTSNRTPVPLLPPPDRRETERLSSMESNMTSSDYSSLHSPLGTREQDMTDSFLASSDYGSLGGVESRGDRAGNVCSTGSSVDSNELFIREDMDISNMSEDALIQLLNTQELFIDEDKMQDTATMPDSSTERNQSVVEAQDNDINNDIEMSQLTHDNEMEMYEKSMDILEKTKSDEISSERSASPESVLDQVLENLEDYEILSGDVTLPRIFAISGDQMSKTASGRKRRKMQKRMLLKQKTSEKEKPLQKRQGPKKKKVPTATLR